MNKKDILDSIKAHYNFRNNADFARFLGITPQTLSNWYTRCTYDAEILHSKCLDISADWLLSRQGEMLRKPKNPVSNEPTASESPTIELSIYKELLKEKDSKIIELSEKIGRQEEQISELRLQLAAGKPENTAQKADVPYPVEKNKRRLAAEGDKSYLTE